MRQVYFRRNAADHAGDDSFAQRAQLEATISELKVNQASMMRMLREQNETNTMLREFIVKSQQPTS